MTNDKENSIVKSDKEEVAGKGAKTKEVVKSMSKNNTKNKPTKPNDTSKKGKDDKPKKNDLEKSNPTVVADVTTEPVVVEETVETPLVEEVSAEPTTEPELKELIADDTLEPVVIRKLKRTTRLETYKKEMTVKKLYKMRDKLNFDLAIQRGLVWTLSQKSNLIHSILYGFPIPQVMVEEGKNNNGELDFLDGKQRISTLISYISGEFALAKTTQDVMGVKIAGQKFSDLEEEFQDYIYDESIQLLVIKNLTDIEREELFSRWNAGSKLSPIEKIRALYSGLFKQIDDEIRDENFYADDIPLTNQARNSFKDVETILHITMLMSNPLEEFRGFGSPQIEKFVLDYKKSNELFPKKLIDKMRSISTYLSMGVSDWGKTAKTEALKRTHVPVIFYTAIKAKADKVKPEHFAEFIRIFLITNYSVDSVYGRTGQNGAPKKESVLTRIREMDKAYDQFFALLKKESSNPKKGIQEFEATYSPTMPKNIEEKKVEVNEEMVQNS